MGRPQKNIFYEIYQTMSIHEEYGKNHFQWNTEGLVLLCRKENGIEFASRVEEKPIGLLFITFPGDFLVLHSENGFFVEVG